MKSIIYSSNNRFSRKIDGGIVILGILGFFWVLYSLSIYLTNLLNFLLSLLYKWQLKLIKRAFKCLKSTVSHYDYYVNYSTGVEAKKRDYVKTVEICKNYGLNHAKTAQVLVQIVSLLGVLWKNKAFMKF